MAININAILTAGSGIPIAANSMLKPRIQFGADILSRDENEVYDGTYTRVMISDLSWLYMSKGAYQQSESNIIGAVQEFGTQYTKVMTEQEYLDLMADGSLAEQWIISYLNGILGAGICTLVDPYTV